MQTELDDARKLLDETNTLVKGLQSRILQLEQARPSAGRPLPDQAAISSTPIMDTAFANMQSTMQALIRIRAVFESCTMVLLNFPVLANGDPE